MIYGKYRYARNSAWQCLIDYNVTSLPVNVVSIAKKAGIKVIENRKVNNLFNKLSPDESGKSIIENDKWHIIFNETESKCRCKFTVAHELGHIVLGHKLKNGHHARTFDLSKPETETEADIFASRLLAPACVLWALDLHTPEEIAKICDISNKAAKIRAERMNILYERNKFLTSPLQKQVYENFKEFINRQKNIPKERQLDGDIG